MTSIKLSDYLLSAIRDGFMHNSEKLLSTVVFQRILRIPVDKMGDGDGLHGATIKDIGIY